MVRKNSTFITLEFGSNFGKRNSYIENRKKYIKIKIEQKSWVA